jgi:hypothetical protein
MVPAMVAGERPLAMCRLQAVQQQQGLRANDYSAQTRLQVYSDEGEPMKVKDVHLKVGDIVVGWTRTRYEVLRIEPFQGCQVCEGCDGMTVIMEIQRVFKNGKRAEDTDSVFGKDIYLYEKVG